jgi:predicted O-linked N-acetylglucosamine transferase (SPINDLY family)
MKICDWTNLDQRLRVLEGKILAGDKATRPFAVLGLFDSPKLQKQCAEIYAKDRLRLSCQLGLIIKKPKRSKIRIGYFSMDFREHPVSHLIAELFDVHDRSKFEIYGFSFGINTRDLMRKRLEKSFDNFLDVKHLSDLDIAHLSRQHEIDIAIDLGGHTQDSRPQIFAERVAPIQINYLGYPGTWGGEYMDYFIADKVAITSDNMQHFSEKIIFLPSCFQVNSRFRPIELSNSSKVDHGVPEGNFVFCCFNNIWKLTPEVFKTWVRILKETEDSILWLQNGGQTAQNNLTKEFESAGIRIDRVVFAERLPSLQDHLARYKLADLFLDTFPYGAHTTASDSLWAGLPILTHAGKSFATRVAASLLNNIGIPELIARTQEEYFSLAVELAKNPEKLVPIRAKFERNRMTIPLFNTRIFAQHIESAYQAAYDRYHLGLPPDHIYVDS